MTKTYEEVMNQYSKIVSWEDETTGIIKAAMFILSKQLFQKTSTG